MRRKRLHGVWLGLLLGITWSMPGWTADTVPAGYRSVAAEYGIPHSVLYAIALVESGREIDLEGSHRPWPWTLNVSGQGHFYPSRQAAWQALNGLLAQGEQSIDIGLMQVSWRYHRDKLGSPWKALDPYHNLRVGAHVLRACFRARRDWWSGVGCYHSPGHAGRAARYRRRVVAHWQRLVSAG